MLKLVKEKYMEQYVTVKILYWRRREKVVVLVLQAQKIPIQQTRISRHYT